MPRLMLAKCATIQALRAGWPAEFSGLYVEEEMERAKLLDASASELADRKVEEARICSLAANDLITVSFGGWNLENVPIGQFAERVLAWMDAPGRASEEVRIWADANREALRTFWAKSPGQAFELKKAIETRSGRMIVPIDTAEDARPPLKAEV